MRGVCLARLGPGEEMGAVRVLGGVFVAVTGRGPSWACVLGVVV